MKLVDTHAHINSKYFGKKDFDDLIQNFNLEKIILPGTTPEDSIENIKLSKKHKNFFPAVGIHPLNASQQNLSFVENLDFDKVVAIGETGIDLYHEDAPNISHQKTLFIEHLNLALKHNLPVIIHMRSSEQEVYEIVKLSKYRNLKFVLHCFTSTWIWAQKFLKLGVWISFSGVLTFKNAKNIHEVAKLMPLERILIETDSPFLAPSPHRGKKNTPLYLKYIIEKVIEIRNESREQIINTIYENTYDLFRLEK